MPLRFNPPPGWPPPPSPDWLPPAGWKPPKGMPAAPDGWVWLVAEPNTEADAGSLPDPYSSYSDKPEQNGANFSAFAGGDAPQAASDTSRETTLDKFISRWNEVVDEVASDSQVTWMLFLGSRPLSWEVANASRPLSRSEGTLTVGVNIPGKLATAASGAHHETLQRAIKLVLGIYVKIVVVLDPESNHQVANNPEHPRSQDHHTARDAPETIGDPADLEKIESLLEQVIQRRQIPARGLPSEYASLAESILSICEVLDSKPLGMIEPTFFDDPLHHAVAVRALTLDAMTAPQIDGTSVKPRTQQEGRLFASVLLRAAIAAAGDGEINKTEELSRRALSFTSDETIRDEALNIIAFAKVQSGDLNAASHALLTALEGELNENLVVNAMHVAMRQEPKSGFTLSGRLLDRAPTLKMRLAIAEATLDRFSEMEGTEAGQSVEASIDKPLLEKFISLLREEDLTEDQYFHLLSALCEADESKLLRPELLSGTPHGNHPGVTFLLTKKSGGIVNSIEEFGKVFEYYGEEPPEWLILERQKFVFTMMLLMSAGGEKKDEYSEGAALLVIAAIDAGVQLPPASAIYMVCYACVLIARMLEAEGHQMAPEIVEKLVWACTWAPEASGEDNDLIPLSRAAASAVQKHLLRRVLQSALELGMTLEGARRRAVNWNAVRQRKQQWRDTLTVLRPFLDSDASDATDFILKQIDEYVPSR